MKALNTQLLCSIAMVAALGATTTMPSFAQEATGNSTTAPAAREGQSTAPADAGTTSSSSSTGDQLVVTVNGSEIRQSDIRDAISTLPPQMQQMPEEMLVGLALDQLVARQLILEEANSQQLAEDPEVKQLVDSMLNRLTEQAVVQVWLTRELEGEITEERLREEFDRYQQANSQSDLTFEQARPQIEQALRQQVMSNVTDRLRQGADVVFFDASGNPVAEPENADSGSSTESGGSEAGASSAEPSESAAEPSAQ